MAVCIATFRRPELLGSLLGSLGRLRFRETPPHVRVVVVDNDAAHTAALTVAGARTSFPFPLSYLVEPERNIARARNRGVRAALRRGAEFVAFVDDDETVEPQWLDELLATQARSGADVVTGPVLPRYDPDVPRWVVRGDFFPARRCPDGARVSWAATNNALVSAGLLRAAAEPFDPAFGISGGSDSVFFLRHARAGTVISWAEAARVHERIPVTRGRAGWLLGRAFRTGNGGVFCERALPPPHGRLPRQAAVGVLRAAFGTVAMLPSVLWGRGGVVRALRQIAYGAGCAAALAGYRYLEYRDAGQS